MQNKRLFIGILAIIVMVAITTAGMFTMTRPSFRSQAVTPPVTAAEISMLDDKGAEFRMSNLRGKVVLLYFGFVNCPDECPLTMAHFKQVLEMLGPTSQDVQVVLVSTDPVRDTPQAMAGYLRAFNPTFIGIPGTLDQLTKVWNEYGVEVLDGGETHSSYTYVIDRSGKQRLNFSPDTTPADMVHDLKILLAEK